MAWSAQHNRKMTHLSPDSFERPGGSGDHTRAPAPARQSGPLPLHVAFLPPKRVNLDLTLIRDTTTDNGAPPFLGGPVGFFVFALAVNSIKKNDAWRRAV